METNVDLETTNFKGEPMMVVLTNDMRMLHVLARIENIEVIIVSPGEKEMPIEQELPDNLDGLIPPFIIKSIDVFEDTPIEEDINQRNWHVLLSKTLPIRRGATVYKPGFTHAVMGFY